MGEPQPIARRSPYVDDLQRQLRRKVEVATHGLTIQPVEISTSVDKEEKDFWYHWCHMGMSLCSIYDGPKSLIPVGFATHARLIKCGADQLVVVRAWVELAWREAMVAQELALYWEMDPHAGCPRLNICKRTRDDRKWLAEKLPATNWGLLHEGAPEQETADVPALIDDAISQFARGPRA